MKYFRWLFCVSAACILPLHIPLALAETNYHAGNFTIALDENTKDGRTYRGCDDRAGCIYLKNGTGWRSRGYRGITWENSGYTYSISWREKVNSSMYLKVFDPQGKLVVHKIMKKNL
jgi:hypothetical protein